MREIGYNSLRNILQNIPLEVWVFITDFGYYVSFLVVGILIFKTNRLKPLFGILFLLLMFEGHGLLKEFIGAGRPIDGTINDGYGFPSGHAFSSGIAGFALEKTRTLEKRTAYFLPLVVGLSRVAIGAHYVPDIIVGWMLSYTVVFISIKIESRDSPSDQKFTSE